MGCAPFDDRAPASTGAPLAGETPAIALTIDARTAPEPGEATHRWDLASADQVREFHDATRARVGASRDDALDASIASLAAVYTAPAGATYDPLSSEVLGALRTMNDSSALGITPLFDEERGEARMVLDLAWFARGSTPEDAAEAYLAAHDGALRTLLGLGPTRELFLTGANDYGDRIAVAFRSRCNGIEVVGDALFLDVSTPSHWLGTGVVDALYASLQPALICPYAAADLISESDAVAAALAAVPSGASIDPITCSGLLRLRRDGVYVWRVQCPLVDEDVASVLVDAYSSAVLGAAEPDRAVSGYVAGNFLLGSGLRFPNDVVDDYPMKFIRVYDSTFSGTPCWDGVCSFIDDADAPYTAPATGYFTSGASPPGLKVYLGSVMPAAGTYSASGVYRTIDATCNTTINATPPAPYTVAGDGSVSDINDDNPARAYYLITWSRERFGSWSHETPQRLGIAPTSGGQARPCSGQPYTWSTVSIPTGASDATIATTLHEADHTWGHCAHIAGYGCGTPPQNDTDNVLDSHIASIKEGHGYYGPDVLTDYLRSPGAFDDDRYYLSDTDQGDWFIHKDDVRLSSGCTSDASCASVPGCSSPASCSCVAWGTTFYCMRDCTTNGGAGVCAADATCASYNGPSACCESRTDVGSGSRLVCSFDNHVNSQIIENAELLVSHRFGPMYGFDLVADGYERGWDSTTRMAGPSGGNNMYAKIWSTSIAYRYLAWRAFSPVFRNLTYSDAGDDFASWSREAGLMTSTGTLTTTINYGSAYGDTTANVDYSSDYDYLVFKAAEGETYTATMTRLGGTLDSCLGFWTVPSGGTSYGFLTQDCTAGGSLNATVTWTVPLGASYDWILVRSSGIGGTTGTYSLVLDMNGDRFSDYSATYPTWQDAFPLAANTGTTLTDTKEAWQYDWLKVYVPNLALATDLVVTYVSPTFTPTTWLYRGCTGSGGPTGCYVTSGTGTTFTYPVSTADDNKWYYILVGSSPSSTSGTYSVKVNLQIGGSDISEDWSSPASPYLLQFPWGEMVADRLASESDGFRVALARGDRMTIEVVPSAFCDAKIEVYTPPLASGLGDAFDGHPFVWDDGFNGADGGTYGYANEVTFVAARDGDYDIDIVPGQYGCYTDYVAYFHKGLVEPANNLSPGFDRTP